MMAGQRKRKVGLAEGETEEEEVEEDGAEGDGLEKPQVTRGGIPGE